MTRATQPEHIASNWKILLISFVFSAIALYLLTVAMLLWWPEEGKRQEGDGSRYNSAKVANSSIMAVVLTIGIARLSSMAGETVLEMSFMLLDGSLRHRDGSDKAGKEEDPLACCEPMDMEPLVGRGASEANTSSNLVGRETSKLNWSNL